MFTADLSWSEPGTETVGQRRERKARERSSTANSVVTSTSSRNSVNGEGERALWWPSGFKKARTSKSSLRRPSSGRSSSSQRTVRTVNQNLNRAPSQDLKHAKPRPTWIFSNADSPNLPTGNSLDLSLHEVPELEGDSSSRRTDSTEPRMSHERQWDVNTPTKIDIFVDGQPPTSPRSPDSFVTSRTRATSVATERELISIPRFPRSRQNEGKHSLPVHIEGPLSFEALKLHNAMQIPPEIEEVRHTMIDDARTMDHLPLSQWECLSPRRTPQELRYSTRSLPKKYPLPQSSNVELNRFQRFIRRMEGASPQVVLDRLKEEWQEGADDGTDEELALEKQLWLLTGLQMQNFGKDGYAPKPLCDTGNILELYSELSELYQASAMYPRHTVHYLTKRPQRKIALPNNVSFLTVREYGVVPLPYPGTFFSHIRAPTLPSLVPSSKMPELFRECHNLLASGGLLELRIMDAAPVRNTAGPLLQTWIEERLLTNLERDFRCSKPCSLVPDWLTAAGFEIASGTHRSSMLLPCAIDEWITDINEELSAVIGRTLWKDTWGDFVTDVGDEPKWWWESKAIIEECLQHRTMLGCRAIYAYKN